MSFVLKEQNYEIDPSWMVETEIMIKRGLITLKNAAKSVRITTILGEKYEISMCDKKLSEIFNKNGKKLFEHGKKGYKKTIPEHIIHHVVEHYNELKCGTKKMWEILNKKNIKCSYNDVNRIYKEVLLRPSKPKKIKEKFVRYEISEVNGAWHGDIHYLCYNNEIKYLFAIIDDKSRYIVGYDISDNKDMQLVHSVLTKSIQNYGAPFIFWTDNGKENVNNLIKSLLDRYTITHIKTMPHTPRQNGKIERWWIELEKRLCPSDSWEIIYEKINDYIYKYNNIIPHHGLEMIGNFHPTPSEIFFSPHLQKTSKENCKIKIDGKPVGIVEFAKLDIEKEKNEMMKKIDITDPFSLLSRPVSF